MGMIEISFFMYPCIHPVIIVFDRFIYRRPVAGMDKREEGRRVQRRRKEREQEGTFMRRHVCAKCLYCE